MPPTSSAEIEPVDEDKNVRVPEHIEKVIARNLPDVLVLSDVNAEGTYRCRRIKKLDRAVVALAKSRKLKVVKISGTELRGALLSNKAGTKHEMAQLLAKRYPAKLASRLPPKRRAWDSENARMDIFDSVGLAVASRTVIGHPTILPMSSR